MDNKIIEMLNAYRQDSNFIQWVKKRKYTMDIYRDYIHLNEQNLDLEIVNEFHNIVMLYKNGGFNKELFYV